MKEIKKEIRLEEKKMGEEKLKGKISEEQNPRAFIKSKTSNKHDRKNNAKVKRDALLQAKRKTHAESPRIVGLLGLSESAISSIKDVFDVIAKSNDVMPTTSNLSNSSTLFLNNSKHRIQLISSNDFHSSVDIAKVADLIVFVFDANGIDKNGDKLISTIKTQGQPSVLGILLGLHEIPQKHRNDKKKDLIKEFNFRFSEEPRVIPVDLNSSQDASQISRYISSTHQSTLRWREVRPYILSDQIKFLPEPNSEKGTLLISGFLRGASIDVNKLVHIPDLGDFQLKQIDLSADPYTKRKDKNSMELNENSPQTTVLAVADPEIQEDLETENKIDPLANEQSIITDEEIREAEKERLQMVKGKQAKKKRVPKGTSAYQAAWIIEAGDEEEGEEEEEDGDEDHGTNMVDDEPEHEKDIEDQSDEEEWVELEEDTNNKKKKEDDVMKDDVKEKKKAEEADVDFPDEVFAPEDSEARIRFQKYRGLKSMRNSEWDNKESLPFEYAKIFQFENWARTKKRVLEEDPLNVQIDDYVTLHIINVPSSKFQSLDQSKPIIVSGLLKYENKISVLHFNILKHSSYEPPVKSKDNLIFHVGFRRFKVQPVFSQNTLNSDKHKYERFLHAGNHTVATIYAPITFPPNPLIVMNSTNNELVATGSLKSVDPDRIILKRIILTGDPFKVNKRSTVVRNMFHNEKDVAWFKPIEIWTKRGRSGRIKESIGIHGHMRCIFDGIVHQNDIVCMSLYKRIFPKWKIEDNTNSNSNGTSKDINM